MDVSLKLKEKMQLTNLCIRPTDSHFLHLACRIVKNTIFSIFVVLSVCFVLTCFTSQPNIFPAKRKMIQIMTCLEI